MISLAVGVGRHQHFPKLCWSVQTNAKPGNASLQKQASKENQVCGSSSRRSWSPWAPVGAWRRGNIPCVARLVMLVGETACSQFPQLQLWFFAGHRGLRGTGQSGFGYLCWLVGWAALVEIFLLPGTSPAPRCLVRGVMAFHVHPLLPSQVNAVLLLPTCCFRTSWEPRVRHFSRRMEVCARGSPSPLFQLDKNLTV